MDYEVIQINDDTWRTEDSGARFFLLTGKVRALLIDSGMTVHNAREIAESLTKLPLSLLNTRADMDHIGSNAQFESFYLHPAEEANYRRVLELLQKMKDLKLSRGFCKTNFRM